MLEYIKARLLAWFNKETQEMEDDKLRHETLCELSQIWDTGNHDPFAHLAALTTKLEKFETGEVVEITFKGDIVASFQLIQKNVILTTNNDPKFVLPIIEMMLTWVNLHRKHLERK